MPTTRGKESPEHRSLKPEVITYLRDTALFDLVLLEDKNCDVAAIIFDTPYRLAVEIERSTRNVLRNVQKDKANGADDVIILAVGDKVYRAINRLLQVNPQERVTLYEVRDFLSRDAFEFPPTTKTKTKGYL